MKDFNGKTAVVTGAASGIGNALSLAFAARGAKVVLADVEANALEVVRADV
ncbi:MAG: SDR family NAD(P)-dependent oxidoreductase, partial [Pseudomonadota bacterium]|nr:SDR family NAD(P)-dependent oxidoreductase [Pseudomonadota bacterium]